MRIAASVVAIAIALGLTACAGGGGPPKPNKRQVAMIDRALAVAPGAAQPSTIVATETAFSRAARERGQWTAFRMFAAPGALLHGANGPFLIEPWLATQTDPPAAVQWDARVVVMSCDGALAVSKGRYRDPEGKVGSFVTVWERQADNSYRYTYDAGGDDVPQPPPRKAVPEGDIVVTEIDAVTGLVATCVKARHADALMPIFSTPENSSAFAHSRRLLGRSAQLRPEVASLRLRKRYPWLTRCSSTPPTPRRPG